MRLIKWILPPIVLAVAVMGFLQLKANKAEIPPRAAQERAWTVRAEVAEPRAISPQIELYAQVENPREVTLTAALAGDVNEVNIREGDRFSKGDLLIALDSRDIDLQVEQQEAQLSSLEAQLQSERLQYETDIELLQIEEEIVAIAQRSLRRQQDLATRSLGSQEQLDNAALNVQQRYLNLASRRQSIANHPNRVSQLEASISQARSQLESLKLDQSRAQLIAPFDGRASAVEIAQGDRMRGGEPLVRIYPDSELEIRAQLPLQVLPLLKSGDSDLTTISGRVFVDGQTLEVNLARLSAEVSKGNAGIDGLFRFNDSAAAPEPGRTLSLELDLPKLDQIIALPPVALYGTDRVYLIKESRMQAVKVEHVGNRSSETGEPKVLVRSSDIVSGDQIITTQLPNAVSGLLVEVTE